MSTEPETTDQTVEELANQMEAVLEQNEAIREQNEQLQERVDYLEDHYQTLQSEHDRVTNLIQQFQTGVIGRRTFMKLVGGAAVTGALVGRATAHQASPSWGSASGTLGKESDPWDRGYIRDLHSKLLHIARVNDNVVSQSGSTGNLDLSQSNFFDQTITGNIGFSFDNPPPSGGSVVLILRQDGTGGHSVNWPSSVEWAGGSAPGLSTGANDKHAVSFISPDGGSTWLGGVIGEGFS